MVAPPAGRVVVDPPEGRLVVMPSEGREVVEPPLGRVLTEGATLLPGRVEGEAGEALTPPLLRLPPLLKDGDCILPAATLFPCWIVGCLPGAPTEP